MSQLIIQERGREEPLIHSCTEEEITVGRHDRNMIQLRGRGVSRFHAKIVSDGENHFIIDLKSGNGTFLNGMRLAPHEKNLLRPGDLITIDTFDLRFHGAEEGGASGRVCPGRVRQADRQRQVRECVIAATAPTVWMPSRLRQL